MTNNGIKDWDDFILDLPNSEIFHKALKVEGVTVEMNAHEPNTGRGLSYLTSIMNYTDKPISVLDKWGHRQTIQPFSNMRPATTITSVVVSVKYANIKTSDRITDVPGHNIIINKQALDNGVVYIPEADVKIGYSEFIYSEKHPNLISDYEFLHMDLIKMQSMVPEGAGLNVAININKKLDPYYHHEIMYVALPWLSTPIYVEPTIINSEYDITLTISEKREGRPNVIIASYHTNKMGDTKFSEIDVVENKFKIFLSPSEHIAMQQGKQFQYYLKNELYSENEVSVETSEKLKESQAEYNELSAKYKSEVATLKTRLDNMKFDKDQVERSLKCEKEKVDQYRAQQSVMSDQNKTQQEFYKTKQQETKTMASIFKDNISVIITGCSVIVALITYLNKQKEG